MAIHAAASPPAATTAQSTEGKRIYTPADFARFAPKTAYDMLVQVPGFTIRSADQERGLGQASENVLINGQRIANKSGGAIDAAAAKLPRRAASSGSRSSTPPASGIAGLTGQVANVIVKADKNGERPVRMEPGLPRPLCQAQLVSRHRSAIRASRAGRLHACRSRTRPAAAASAAPIVIYRPLTARSSSAATKSIIGEYDLRRPSRPSSGSTGPARRSAI